MPDIADKFRRKNLLDELYKQTGAERLPSVMESEKKDRLDKRDKDVLLRALMNRVTAPTGAETGFEPSSDVVTERQRKQLGKLSAKELGGMYVGVQRKDTAASERAEAERVAAESNMESGAKAGIESALGVPVPVAAPKPTQRPEPVSDASMNEPDSGPPPGFYEKLQEAGVDPAAVEGAKAKEDQDEFAYWKGQIEQYGNEYQGQINALRQQLEDEKPDLWSPGSILYMLSVGPQKWIQRHDQMNERYKDRRDAIVRAGLEGKLREGGQMSQLGQTKAYLGARKDRPAPVRRGGSPALIYKDIMVRYGQNISGLKSPDDVFQYTVDKLDETTGKVVKVPKTGNIYSASLEWGKRYGLSPEESEQVAQAIIQSKFGGIK